MATAAASRTGADVIFEKHARNRQQALRAVTPGHADIARALQQEPLRTLLAP